MKNKTPIWIFLIRFWSGGAIYFLIGWGTQLGRYTSLIDLVFFLGLSIGLANTFIVNPIIKMLYNVGWHKSYGSSKYVERIICRIKDMSLGFASTIAVMGIYNFINGIANKMLSLSEGEIFLPGEPILYGLFYAIVISIFVFIINKISQRIKH